MVILECVAVRKKATGRGYYIGDKLSTLLAERGITPYRLAKMTGITQPAISMIVNNKRAASPEKIERIAQALGVPMSYFIEEEPPKEYPPTPEVVEREYYPPEKLTDEWRIVGRVVQKMPKMEPINVE